MLVYGGVDKIFYVNKDFGVLDPKVLALDALRGVRVTAIAAGAVHSMVKTDESDEADRTLDFHRAHFRALARWWVRSRLRKSCVPCGRGGRQLERTVAASTVLHLFPREPFICGVRA